MLIIKIGGGKNINFDNIAADLASLVKAGRKIILIHGASENRDEIAQRLGIPTKTIMSPSGISSVLTDSDAIDVFLMAYCGVVNKRLVEKLFAHNINAVGLSGVDGRLRSEEHTSELQSHVKP